MKKQLIHLSQIAEFFEKQGNIEAGRILTASMRQIVAADRVQRKLTAGVWKGKREQMLEDPDFRKLPEWQRERILEQFETMSDGKEQLPQLTFRSEQNGQAEESKHPKINCPFEPVAIEGKESGFLAPDGTFYEVCYAGHRRFAEEMAAANGLYDNSIAYSSSYRHYIQLLNDKGWVDLHQYEWRKNHDSLRTTDCTKAQTNQIQNWFASLPKEMDQDGNEASWSLRAAVINYNPGLRDWFM